MRSVEKVPGGKLVCIEAEVQEGKTTIVKITGDFFLHPEDAIDGLERSLLDLKAGSSESEISEKIKESLARSGALLIGASPEDLARIFKRAMG
ncbi:MAG: biotin--protein ligase [Candidatus Micrarchaeota archaeon]